MIEYWSVGEWIIFAVTVIAAIAMMVGLHRAEKQARVDKARRDRARRYELENKQMARMYKLNVWRSEIDVEGEREKRAERDVVPIRKATGLFSDDAAQKLVTA